MRKEKLDRSINKPKRRNDEKGKIEKGRAESKTHETVTTKQL